MSTFFGFEGVSGRIEPASGGSGTSRAQHPGKLQDDDIELLICDWLGDVFDDLPPVLIRMASASLEHSAEMMREIVEETRNDHVEFDIARRHIDRKLARIDELLATVFEPQR